MTDAQEYKYPGDAQVASGVITKAQQSRYAQIGPGAYTLELAGIPMDGYSAPAPEVPHTSVPSDLPGLTTEQQALADAMPPPNTDPNTNTNTNVNTNKNTTSAQTSYADPTLRRLEDQNRSMQMGMSLDPSTGNTNMLLDNPVLAMHNRRMPGQRVPIWGAK